MIGAHPHCGFSLVTSVIEGEVKHRDGRGDNKIAKKDGDFTSAHKLILTQLVAGQ